MRWFGFLRNFPLGILLGLLMGITFTAWLGTDPKDVAVKYATYGLTAIISLLASGVALATAIWNTESQRERKLLAARATLPLALTHLYEVAKNGFEFSSRDLPFLDNPENAKKVERGISLPNEVLEALKECIEYTDPVTTQWLANVIAHYQIYRSRLVGGIRDESETKTKRWMAERASEWVFWYSMVAHLYEFSRGANKAPHRLDEDKLTQGFFFELAGHGLQHEITESVQAFAEYYAPLDHLSTRLHQPE